MRIGILALQGDFEAHRDVLLRLGASPILVRKSTDLSAVSGLILPGGESAVMLKLMEKDLFSAISSFTLTNPVLGTCAGAILLAKNVMNPKQRSFGAIDIDIVRNAYGRQINSFVSTEITWSTDGTQFLVSNNIKSSCQMEGLFIRAPKITRVGSSAQVLCLQGEDPVLVKEKKVLAATFHTEIGVKESLLHKVFLVIVDNFLKEPS